MSRVKLQVSDQILLLRWDGCRHLMYRIKSFMHYHVDVYSRKALHSWGFSYHHMQLLHDSISEHWFCNSCFNLNVVLSFPCGNNDERYRLCSLVSNFDLLTILPTPRSSTTQIFLLNQIHNHLENKTKTDKETELCLFPPIEWITIQQLQYLYVVTQRIPITSINSVPVVTKEWSPNKSMNIYQCILSINYLLI